MNFTGLDRVKFGQTTNVSTPMSTTVGEVDPGHDRDPRLLPSSVGACGGRERSSGYCTKYLKGSWERRSRVERHVQRVDTKARYGQISARFERVGGVFDSGEITDIGCVNKVERRLPTR